MNTRFASLLGAALFVVVGCSGESTTASPAGEADITSGRSCSNTLLHGVGQKAGDPLQQGEAMREVWRYTAPSATPEHVFGLDIFIQNLRVPAKTHLFMDVTLNNSTKRIDVTTADFAGNGDDIGVSQSFITGGCDATEARGRAVTPDLFKFAADGDHMNAWDITVKLTNAATNQPVDHVHTLHLEQKRFADLNFVATKGS
jgi:hypothetical protein